jgi:membrane fusion protein, multidrug efflux system
MTNCKRRPLLQFMLNCINPEGRRKNSPVSTKYLIFRVFLLILPALFMLAGCGKKVQQNAQPGKGRRGGPVFVEVKVVQPQPLQNVINTTGSILANERVDLKPEVSGRVTNIYFQEGSLVTKGKLLVKLNDAELQAQLKRNKAQEQLLTDDVFRKSKLLEIRAISQEEYEASTNQLQIVQAEKQLILAQIEKTEIYAPFSGKIGLRSVSPGNFIVNNTIVASLQQLDPVKIEFDVPEKYSALVKEGMTINFNIENMDSTFLGKIYAVESSISSETRTLKIRALSTNPRGVLIPGTYARISIVLEEFPEAIEIPSEAMINELEGNSVFIMNKGKALKTKIKPGIRTENSVQILEGVSIGDSLITTGLLQISNGSPVTLVRSGRQTMPSETK